MRKLKLKTEEEDVIRIDEIDLSRHLVVLTEGSAKYILCKVHYNVNCNGSVMYNWKAIDSTISPPAPIVWNSESLKESLDQRGTIDIYEL